MDLKIIWDRVYLIVAVILIVMVSYIDFETFGLNKTVGYAYDLTNVAKLLCLISLLLFFFCYLILSILKYKNPFSISAIYIFSILIAVAISIYFANPFLVFAFGFLSIIALLLNVIIAVKNGRN